MPETGRMGSVLDPGPRGIRFAGYITCPSDAHDDDEGQGEGEDDPHVENQQGSEQCPKKHGRYGDEPSA
jgi:hypothetical protein